MVKLMWSADMVNFVADHFKRHPVEQVAVLVNERFGSAVTASQVRSLVKNRKLRSGRRSGEITKGRYRLFTAEQVDFIKRGYQELDLKSLTAAINNKFGTSFTIVQIRSFTRNHRIRSGRTGRYEPGTKPHNTGTKGVMKANSGSFRKGNKPQTWVPVGTIAETSRDRYYKLKIAEPNKWVMLHRHIWEQHNGPIPTGHIVTFKDGNRHNCDISNLVLTSRARHAVRNRHSAPAATPELRELVETVVDLRLMAGAAQRALKQKRRRAA